MSVCASMCMKMYTHIHTVSKRDVTNIKRVMLKNVISHILNNYTAVDVQTQTLTQVTGKHVCCTTTVK